MHETMLTRSSCLCCGPFQTPVVLRAGRKGYLRADGVAVPMHEAAGRGGGHPGRGKKRPKLKPPPLAAPRAAKRGRLQPPAVAAPRRRAAGSGGAPGTRTLVDPATSGGVAVPVLLHLARSAGLAAQLAAGARRWHMQHPPGRTGMLPACLPAK